MKISLCAIVGNCESLITRFLDAFQPHVDEVCLVRAIGNQQPDKTLEIAGARGCRVGEYKNPGKLVHPIDGTGDKWPHVESFGDARQQAWDMATGDWVMWADHDDTFWNNTGTKLHRLLENMPEDCVGLMLPYIVPSDGLEVMRERVMRRGHGKWCFPIHECLDVGENAKMAKSTDVKLFHDAPNCRAQNDQRNLRILESIPEDQLTISSRFHKFQSLRAVGREEDAVRVAIETVKQPDIGDNEKYELLIALGQLSKTIGERGQLYLQALGTDPTRREAYGELALVELANGDNPKALAYTQAMNALPKPADWAWNARRKYYGWLARHLKAMALRANGRQEEADVMELNAFRRAGCKISLVHATRGRPKAAFKARADAFDMADNPDGVEHIFGLDLDDKTAQSLMICRSVANEGIGCVGAWNAATRSSCGEVIVQMSDDWRFFKGWDTAILEAIGDTSKPAVLAISDGARNDDLLCMAILTRARLEQQNGFLFHPDFFGVFSDDWFTQCAKRDGVLIDARDRITFEHMHPVFKKSEWDETYVRQNSEGAYRTGKIHFDRLTSGKLTSYDIHGWCDFRIFYHAVSEILAPGDIFVELGAWMGQSIVHLAQRLQDSGKECALFCVDTWQGEQNQPAHVDIVAAHGGSLFNKFVENIKGAGVDEMVTPILSDSAEAAARFDDKSVDGIFIDAAHDYESVKKDLAAWWPKMKAKAIWSGHDYRWPDVKRAVDEHAEAHGYKVMVRGNVWCRA